MKTQLWLIGFLAAAMFLLGVNVGIQMVRAKRLVTPTQEWKIKGSTFSLEIDPTPSPKPPRKVFMEI